VILLGTNYLSVIGHEEAHKKINSYSGASSTSHITFSFTEIKGMNIIDENATFYDEEYERNAYFAHGINEAIGYQLIPFFNGIMILLSIIIIILIALNLEV
jgi:hypothetical protein